MARDVVERLRAELQPEPAGGSPMRSLTFTKDEGNALLAVVEAAKRLQDMPDNASYDAARMDARLDLQNSLARLYAGSSGESEKRLPPIEDLDYMPPRGCVG